MSTEDEYRERTGRSRGFPESIYLLPYEKIKAPLIVLGFIATAPGVLGGIMLLTSPEPHESTLWIGVSIFYFLFFPGSLTSPSGCTGNVAASSGSTGTTGSAAAGRLLRHQEETPLRLRKGHGLGSVLVAAADQLHHHVVEARRQAVVARQGGAGHQLVVEVRGVGVA